MENFKIASQKKLRFQTSKGSLSTEQLWDLSLDELDALAVSLDTEYSQSNKKSFLVKTSSKDKVAKLKFDIVLDVLNTKNAEAEALTEAKEKKEFNERIITLIAEKEDETLKGKSAKELRAMLKS